VLLKIGRRRLDVKIVAWKASLFTRAAYTFHAAANPGKSVGSERGRLAGVSGRFFFPNGNLV